MKDIRILLVDNHEVVRRGERNMLGQEEDMEIVGDCSSAEEALPQMEILSPNVILMETKMPGMVELRLPAACSKNGCPVMSLC